MRACILRRLATSQRSREIRHFLETGDHDPLFSAWEGTGVIDRAERGSLDLANALLSKLKARASKVIVPRDAMPNDGDPTSFIHRKVGPMVKGLFRVNERQPVDRWANAQRLMDCRCRAPTDAKHDGRFLSGSLS